MSSSVDVPENRRRVVYGPPPLAFHASHGQALKDLPTPLIDVRGCWVVCGPPPLTFTASHGQALKDLPTPLIDVRGCS